LAHAGGTGEQLAACVDFAAFGTRDPRVSEWFREAFERKPSHVVLTSSFTSPRPTDDRLLELFLAPLGDDVPVDRFAEHVITLQSVGAQGPEMLGVCSRWLEARGHAPVAPAIDLREPGWDGGHRTGGNAVQSFLARVWAADPHAFEDAAQQLFERMMAPGVVAAICASLPFEEKLEVDDGERFRRLFRQGRLLVTHTGRNGQSGRIGVTLHADREKAEKAAAKHRA
jgi:hypothetical protein